MERADAVDTASAGAGVGMDREEVVVHDTSRGEQAAGRGLAAEDMWQSCLVGAGDTVGLGEASQEVFMLVKPVIP